MSKPIGQPKRVFGWDKPPSKETLRRIASGSPSRASTSSASHASLPELEATRRRGPSGSSSKRRSSEDAFARSSYPSGDRWDPIAMRPPVDLVDSSMRAEARVGVRLVFESALLVRESSERERERERETNGAPWGYFDEGRRRRGREYEILSRVVGRVASLCRRPADWRVRFRGCQVSMLTASLMRERALLEYKEARCHGAAWLWTRATRRAGGSRTISMLILRLWFSRLRFPPSLLPTRRRGTLTCEF